MNYDNIPIELKALDRWVIWTDEGVKGKKVPYDANYVKSRASSTNPETWSSFDVAVTAYEEDDSILGLGFVLNGDGLCGVDIDHVIHDGVIEPLALEVLEQLDAAYISISPSGTGLRAFGYAVPLLQGCKGKYEGLDLELYSNQRFLTVTDRCVKHEPLRELQHFESLAHHIRSDKHIDTATGEILDRNPTDHHAELIKRILTGDVFHDSLRDLAASLIASGAHAGAVVNHLKALMAASNAPKDQRYHERYKQISALVRSAQQKYNVYDPFAGPQVKDDENIFDALGALYANELPSVCEPPDELIEELIVERSTAILWGDSNVGKSFLSVAMAAAVSDGADFLGKRTSKGLAVYVAAESPESIRMRLQAHQRYYGCSLENLLIIQHPIDMYADDSDCQRIIEVIHQAEQQRDLAANFIVMDTLARVTAGSDENSLQSMQPVMQRIDRLMNATKASVLVVHHSSKNGTAARGHSSIRAHIDSELMVTEEDGERKIIVTKQRSLASKNNEMPFNLVPIHMGYNKWSRPISTCVVTH